MGRRKILTSEVLEKCRRASEAGSTIEALAAEYGVAASTLIIRLSSSKNKTSPSEDDDTIYADMVRDRKRIVKATKLVSALDWRNLTSESIDDLRRMKQEIELHLQEWEADE